MPSGGDNHAAFVFALMGAKVTSADISERQLENAKNINRILKNQGYSFLYDMHPFSRPFSGETWEGPKIIKQYQGIAQRPRWRVQDIVSANIMAGLSINELAELPAVDASFWFTYDELNKKVRMFKVAISLLFLSGQGFPEPPHFDV